MSSVVLSNLTFEAKSGDQLEEVSLGLMSPKMVAICSDNAGTVLALEQLLMDQGKIIEGSAQINGEDITKYKRHPERVVASFDQTVLKGKTVEKAIARALKHVKGALDVTQTLQMLLPLGIKYDEKVATLSAAQ